MDRTPRDQRRIHVITTHAYASHHPIPLDRIHARTCRSTPPKGPNSTRLPTLTHRPFTRVRNNANLCIGVDPPPYLARARRARARMTCVPSLDLTTPDIRGSPAQPPAQPQMGPAQPQMGPALAGLGEIRAKSTLLGLLLGPLFGVIWAPSSHNPRDYPDRRTPKKGPQKGRSEPISPRPIQRQNPFPAWLGIRLQTSANSLVNYRESQRDPKINPKTRFVVKRRSLVVKRRRSLGVRGWL